MIVRITECIDRYNRKREPGEPPMTQARLAELLDVTQGAVSLWVNGQRAIGVPTALKIAEILGCSLDDLFSTATDSQGVIAQ